MQEGEVDEEAKAASKIAVKVLRKHAVEQAIINKKEILERN